MPSDILQTIGNVLRPRCDTFTIRAYGASMDEEGNIMAEAYCEARIQRGIDYVDASNANEAKQNDEFGADLGLSDLNKSYGRKLRVVGFKWLNKTEI